MVENTLSFLKYKIASGEDTYGWFEYATTIENIEDKPTLYILIVTKNPEHYNTCIENISIQEDDKVNVVISIEHLNPRLKKAILLELNDKTLFGRVLESLDIAKNPSVVLGDELYILDVIDKKYTWRICAFLESLYEKVIKKVGGNK